MEAVGTAGFIVRGHKVSLKTCRRGRTDARTGKGSCPPIGSGVACKALRYLLQGFRGFFKRDDGGTSPAACRALGAYCRIDARTSGKRRGETPCGFGQRDWPSPAVQVVRQAGRAGGKEGRGCRPGTSRHQDRLRHGAFPWDDARQEHRKGCRRTGHGLSRAARRRGRAGSGSAPFPPPPAGVAMKSPISATAVRPATPAESSDAETKLFGSRLARRGGQEPSPPLGTADVLPVSGGFLPGRGLIPKPWCPWQSSVPRRSG